MKHIDNTIHNHNKQMNITINFLIKNKTKLDLHNEGPQSNNYCRIGRPS